MNRYPLYAKTALHYVLIILLMLTFFSSLTLETQDRIIDMFQMAYSELTSNRPKGSN